MVRTPGFHFSGLGLLLGLGTEIPPEPQDATKKKKKSVLCYDSPVCLGYHHTIPQPGWLNQQRLILS